MKKNWYECGNEIEINGQKTWLHLHSSLKNGWYIAPHIWIKGKEIYLIFEHEIQRGRK